MISFLVRRLAISVVLLAIVSVVSFTIIRLAPGTQMMGSQLDPRQSAAIMQIMQEKYYLDRTLPEQYVLVMRDLFTNNLKSYRDRLVTEQIMERLPYTLLLNSVSLLIVFSFGISLGIWGGRWRGGARDQISTFFSFVLIAIPSFFVSYMICILLVKYVEVPILGVSSFGVEYRNQPIMKLFDVGWHLFAPALVLALPGIAVQSRYVRASMIETLGEEYIRTARAKGLAESVVYYKHALRNSLRPIITFIGFLLAGMLGGSVIVERIFGYPGMGRLAFEALESRDVPILVAINFVAAALVICGNLLADILYSVVDPRVRLE